MLPARTLSVSTWILRSSFKADLAHGTRYRFEIDGRAEIVGPLRKEFICTLGLPCNATIEGSSLATTNHLLIISQGECGQPNVPRARLRGK